MRKEYQPLREVSDVPGLGRLPATGVMSFFRIGLSAGLCLMAVALTPLAARAAELRATLPAKLTCQASQTAGLHDYAGAPEDYEPSTFFESKFKLAINKVLMQHLAPEQSVASNPTDLFLTMLPRNEDPIELRCRQVQGAPGELGFSCVNSPPSELLLINAVSLRFTRSSIGGWVFGSSKSITQDDGDGALGSATDDPIKDNPGLADDSLFVEYGGCE